MSVNKISSFKHMIKNQQVKPQKDNRVGVVDRKFITPTANRTADVTHKIEWFRLGNVNVSEMH
ncbi:hypothetical protein [Avibacterium paragallinarum]|uniref:hypothetical protein n=1 Tax=Avibacterium paragallinarum TaxID=728 RepID=UPI003D7081CB